MPQGERMLQTRLTLLTVLLAAAISSLAHLQFNEMVATRLQCRVLPSSHPSGRRRRPCRLRSRSKRRRWRQRRRQPRRPPGQ